MLTNTNKWEVPHDPKTQHQNVFLRSDNITLFDKLNGYAAWAARTLKDVPYVFRNYDDDKLFDTFQAQLKDRPGKYEQIYILSFASDHEWIDEEAVRENKHKDPKLM